jgi:arylsulfatase A-like enzyme
VIDSIVADQQTFRCTEHLSNASTTPVSFPSIMCSRYRLEADGTHIPRKWPTIASVLKEAGFYTAGFNSANPFVSRYFGYDRGFDEFHDFMERGGAETFDADEWGTWKRRVFDLNDVMRCKRAKDKQFQDSIFAAFVEKRIGDIVQTKDKWFAWVHYMDVHGSYAPSSMFYSDGLLNSMTYLSFLNMLVVKNLHPRLSRFREDLINLYDDAILQVDRYIGRLWMAVPDDTMFIITSDHGEGFEEHGTWTHPYYALYNECLRTPLIVHDPSRDRVLDVSHPTSSVDIMPTILERTDAWPPSIVRGANVISDSGQSHIVFHEGTESRTRTRKDRKADNLWAATVNGKRLVLLETEDHEVSPVRFYDLKKDPSERRNLIDDASMSDEYLTCLSKIVEHMDNENKTKQLEGFDVRAPRVGS